MKRLNRGNKSGEKADRDLMDRNDTELHETIVRARERLVELWVELSDDHSRFTRLESELFGELHRTKGKREARVEQVRQEFEEGWNLSEQPNPLLLLNALDELLAEYSGARSTGTGFSESLFMLRVGEQEHHLYRRPQGMIPARVDNQMGHLRGWVRHHQVLPKRLRGYQIEIVRPSDVLVRQLHDLRDEHRQLKVAICQFRDGVAPVWLPEHLPNFKTEDLTDPDARWRTVQEVLERGCTEGVHVLVLPELTVPPSLRRRIRDWLEERSDVHSFLLVLPGSFHELVQRGTGTTARVLNRTELLGSYGQREIVHDKLLAFGRWDSGVELIELGQHIHLLALPLGNLVTPICLDFCEADHPMAAVWKELSPSWFLVPAMGDQASRKAHAAAAKSLFTTRRSITVLANQPTALDKAAPGFIYDGTAVTADPSTWDTKDPGLAYLVVEVDGVPRKPEPPLQSGPSA